MLGIFFLKHCEGALLEVKPEDMTDVAYETKDLLFRKETSFSIDSRRSII